MLRKNNEPAIALEVDMEEDVVWNCKMYVQSWYKGCHTIGKAGAPKLSLKSPSGQIRITVKEYYHNSPSQLP